MGQMLSRNTGSLPSTSTPGAARNFSMVNFRAEGAVFHNAATDSNRTIFVPSEESTPKREARSTSLGNLFLSREGPWRNREAAFRCLGIPWRNLEAPSGSRGMLSRFREAMSGNRGTLFRSLETMFASREVLLACREGLFGSLETLYRCLEALCFCLDASFATTCAISTAKRPKSPKPTHPPPFRRLFPPLPA
jgi:hypothetical protein